MSIYKKTTTFAERKLKSLNMITQYPDRTPVIIDLNESFSKKYVLDKNKYLIPFDISLAHFASIIRKRLKIEQSKALYFFINNKLFPLCIINQDYFIDKFIILTYPLLFLEEIYCYYKRCLLYLKNKILFINNTKLKAIGSYKLEDLINICSKLNLNCEKQDGKKMLKKDIYELILKKQPARIITRQ